nr:DDE-type integrase/transposase/recombinase [Streptomyces sp. NBC_00576]
MDIPAQNRRDKTAARRYFHRPMKRGTGAAARVAATDKPRPYRAAHREIMPRAEHHQPKHPNNQAREQPPAHPAA